MMEIDKPFRISGRFAMVWACLAGAVGLLVFRRNHGAAYEKVIITVLGSLYVTFCLYGPILLARQIIKSGGRGVFVLQVLLTIFLGVALVFGALVLTNHGNVPYEAIVLVTFF